MNKIKKYKAVRIKMESGDVIAFQGSGLGAKAIQRFTKSKYSHVGLVIKIKELGIERVFIAESGTKSGVVLWPLSQKLKDYPGRAWWMPLKVAVRKRSDYPLPVIEEGVRTTILKWAMSQLGKPYDFKLIKKIAKNILLKMDIGKEDYQEYICSEYVAKAFKETGLLPKGRTTNLTPEDICKLPSLKKPIGILW